jgi:hypothetical protein
LPLVSSTQGSGACLSVDLILKKQTPERFPSPVRNSLIVGMASSSAS